MVLFVCPEHSGVGAGVGEGAGLLRLDRLAAVGDGGLMLSPALGVGQHEFDPVLLVDPGCAGIIVDGDDVAHGVVVLQLADHPLAHDVVGQAAEGLGADDVAGTGVDQLQHLSGEQPAFAHLVAVAQVAVDEFV